MPQGYKFHMVTRYNSSRLQWIIWQAVLEAEPRSGHITEFNIA